LSCLNRDIKKIIFLDWDEKAFQLQPRNALHRFKKWDGNDDDRQLLHLAAFLRSWLNYLSIFIIPFLLSSDCGKWCRGCT
jgi:hypothetical protein